jgi:NACHT domain
LIFADVPQDGTFVDMHVVADEPVYDAPGEQKRQLETTRQRTNLSNEEREAYLQRLRIIWRSQLRWDVDEEKAQQPLLLTEVLQRFTSTSPVAILLGTPGSGKTTYLRWLALHMARACLAHGKYTLPHGLGRPQVPLLIQMNDYAERLEKEYITLKQFLITQWNRIHPTIAMKLLDELAQGHCLILFDGLDEGASASVRRRVLDAMNGFISDYSSEDPNIYNRFIITSRIADREHEAFNRYVHYTLLELDEQRIDQILANWYFTLARYWAISVKGGQTLTKPEEAEARAASTKQQVQLSRIIRSNPNLRQIAMNPMVLTMMVTLQASGRKLPLQRMELYQMITRTLLDTWNQESGRKMFTGEEMPLAEQLLSNLAYQLQESDGMLTAYDVAMTTRQTLAAFYQRQLNEVRESDITQFIKTLRRSSGLIVEGGEDLFYFANRPLQDYFVVLYLLRMPQEELIQLVVQHYHAPNWREPLLLLLSYKSRQILLRGLSRRRDKPPPRVWSPAYQSAQLTPEERARNLQALLKGPRLTKQCVEELLASCTDTRLLSVGKQQELGVDTVQRMAWKVLSQPLLLDQEALDMALAALDAHDASICEGAAMLLQHSTSMPQDEQQRAVQKIQQMLLDDTMYHQFSAANFFELLRLYNTLFESLKALGVRS